MFSTRFIFPTANGRIIWRVNEQLGCAFKRTRVSMSRGMSRDTYELIMEDDSKPYLTSFDDVAPPGTVNLRMGVAGKDFLANSASLLKESADNRLGRSDVTNLMLYGPIFGDSNFHTQLGRFLSSQYGSPVSKRDIVQTAGATNGLHIAVTLLFSPGDLVFMESTSYFLALTMLRDGLRLRPVPVFQDCNGIDPDALEDSIKANLSTRSNWKPTASKPYWAMLYLIPQFHNPTGVCLSSERSQRIIQIARRYNLLVICDDVYNLLYFPSHYPSGHPPQRLFAYDKKDDSDYAGNVISNGSFSKIFAPGVRCGWMEVPQVVKSIFKYSLLFESGGAINHAMCGLLTNLMEQDKLTRPIEEARLIHEERCKAVVDVFRTRLPFIELQPPTGGYFIWFKLPHNINSDEFIEKCLNEKKIALFSGKVFNVDPDNTENDRFIRITFSYYDKDELVKAAHLIADAMIELQQQV